MASPGARPTLSNAGATVAHGMLWAALATIAVKGMALASQVALGYLLDPGAYAIFALASIGTALIAGLQNSGIEKSLIQQGDRFDDLVEDYSGLAIWLGLLGGAILVLAGLVLARLYGSPELVAVLSLWALAIPLISLNGVYSARISVELRFKKLQVASMLLGLVYNACLVAFAWLGADYLTLALATGVSQLFLFLLYRRIAGSVRIGISRHPGKYVSILVMLRWTMAANMLFGLARNADYFILAFLLPAEDLGRYFFAFMLVTNIGILLMSAIGQVFLPVLSQVKDDTERLRQALVRASGPVGFLCGLVCVGAVGLLPAAIHFVWQGKWDATIPAVLAMTVAMPLRIFVTLASVVIEARGKWRKRALLLANDGITLMLAAAIGAHFGGFVGAAIGAAVQTAASGMLTFTLACREIGIGIRRSSNLQLRAFAPFAAAIAALMLLDSGRHFAMAGGLPELALCIGETAAACILFVAATLLVDRTALTSLLAIAKRR